LGNIFDGSYEFPEIKKPQKPLAVSRPVQGMFGNPSQSDAVKDWEATQHNFLSEMFKMMPSYEQSQYTNDYDDMPDQLKEYDPSYAQGQDPRFGLVNQARTSQGYLVGAGAADKFKKNINYREGFADYDHNAEAGFEDLNLEEISVAGMSPGLFQKINGRFNADTRNHYQLIMDQDSGSLSALSDEDAFLMLGSLFESRSRVYNAMTTLFGDANITSDAERIQHIDQWLNNEGAEMSDDSKRIFLMYLGSFRGFFSRTKALMGMGTDDIQSPLDKQKFSEFSSALQQKVNAYLQSMSDSDPRKEETQALVSAWYQPEQDGTGWFLQKGNRVKGAASIPGEIDTIFDQVARVDRAQLVNRKNASEVWIEDAQTGSGLHTGKAYSEVWGVHAYGVLQYFEDRVVDQSVMAGARNRADFYKFMEEMKVYDEKLETAKQEVNQQKKSEARSQAESQNAAKKAENQAQQRAQAFRAELQKSLQMSQQRQKGLEKQSLQMAQKAKQVQQGELKKSTQQSKKSSQQMTQEQKKAMAEAQAHQKQAAKKMSKPKAQPSEAQQLHQRIMKANKQQAQQQKKKNNV
jgi:hypothetical protein